MTERDPAIQGAIAREAQREAQRKAEAERRVAEAAQRRQVAARAELEDERRRREFVWMSHGGSPEDFDKAWPEIQRDILMARQREHERLQQQSANVFK